LFIGLNFLTKVGARGEVIMGAWGCPHHGPGAQVRGALPPPS